MDDKLFDEFVKGKAREEKILLPSGLNQRISNTLKELPKRKKYHTKLFRLGSVAAILALCVLTSIGFASPSFANISYTFSSSISNFLGIQRNLDDYKTVINKAITDKSITVKLDEVILDENELTVSYSITSNKKLEEYDSWDAFHEIYVNGNHASIGGAGSSRNTDDYTTQTVMTHYLDKVDLSADLNIKIACSAMRLNEKETKGSWDFEFKTNGKQLEIDTKEMLLGNKFNLENGEEYTLEKCNDNALGQKIYASVRSTLPASRSFLDFVLRTENDRGKAESVYAVELRGTDNLGNKVEFYMSRGDKDSALFKIQNIDGNLNENARILTLTPYAAKYPDQSGKMDGEYKQVGDEFTIDLSLLK